MKSYTQDVLLYGASGHCKVIIDCLDSVNIGVKGIFDDNSKQKTLFSIPVIDSYDKNKYSDLPVIISIGNNLIRKKVSKKIEHLFTTIIHSSASISPSAVLNNGSVIIHGAIVQSSTIIGKHCIINTAATVDHDCNLKDFVHISPNSTLCGNISVGEGAHIGAGATIIQGLNIGKWATVGAGAVVINDVPDYAVVVGCPARIIRFNKKEYFE